MTKIKELVEHITTSIVFEKSILESEGLSPEIWDKYFSQGTSKTRKSGDYVFSIGDNISGIYFIKRGKIKGNFLGRDGNLKTFVIVGEGCTFGEQFVLHDQPGLFEAVVVDDALLYYFDKDTMLDIMKRDFDINLFIIKSLAVKSRMLAVQLEDMCLRNILQSLCRILYSFCCYEEKNGEIVGDIVIPLSHQDLANMVGSHRVTITKNLAYLKKIGVLDYKYEKIFIKEKTKLKDIAFE